MIPVATQAPGVPTAAATGLFKLTSGRSAIGLVNLARVALSGGAYSGAAGVAMAGPAIVVTAASAILTAWITQWQAIEEARPLLVITLENAKQQPVNLRALVATDIGVSLVTTLWATAMEAGDPDHPDIVYKANMAWKAAQAKNYSLPN